MIAYLDGWAIKAEKPYFMIKTGGRSQANREEGGVGYLVALTDRDWGEIPINNNMHGTWIHLWIYTAVSEKALDLYGFKTRKDRQAFRLILSVSGIGPKLALAMLSHFGIGELGDLVHADDAKGLAAMPGLGPKKAKKLIPALKDKLPKPEFSDRASGFRLHEQVAQDVVDALRGMSFCKRDAEAALAMVVSEQGEGLGGKTVQGIITDCLAVLTKRE